MKFIAVSCLIFSLILGSLTGWQRGLEETTRHHAPHNIPTTPEGAEASGESAPRTREEWLGVTAAIPQPFSPYHTAHMARLRQSARGLPMEVLKSLLAEGWDGSGSGAGTDIPLTVLLDEMIGRDAAQACEFLIQHHQQALLPKIFTVWGRQNPAAALAWLTAHPEYEENRAAVLTGWAEHDPAAAFAMMITLPDSTATFDPLFFTHWAKMDPDAAVSAWASHQDKAFCRSVFWGLALNQCGPERRDQLLAAFQRISNPDVRAEGITHFASWLALQNPAEAILLTTDPTLPEPQRRKMRMRVAEAWLQRDSGKAADWFWSSGSVERKAETMETLLRTWNGAGEHSAACMEWIQNQPADSLPPETPQLLVKSLFQYSPEIALKSWLKLAANRQDRADAAAALGKYLVGTPQGTRLPSLLREAGFDPELTRQVLEAGRLESP